MGICGHSKLSTPKTQEGSKYLLVGSDYIQSTTGKQSSKALVKEDWHGIESLSSSEEIIEDLVDDELLEMQRTRRAKKLAQARERYRNDPYSSYDENFNVLYTLEEQDDWSELFCSQQANFGRSQIDSKKVSKNNSPSAGKLNLSNYSKQKMRSRELSKSHFKVFESCIHLEEFDDQSIQVPEVFLKKGVTRGNKFGVGINTF